MWALTANIGSAALVVVGNASRVGPTTSRAAIPHSSSVFCSHRTWLIGRPRGPSNRLGIVIFSLKARDQSGRTANSNECARNEIRSINPSEISDLMAAAQAHLSLERSKDLYRRAHAICQPFLCSEGTPDAIVQKAQILAELARLESSHIDRTAYWKLSLDRLTKSLDARSPRERSASLRSESCGSAGANSRGDPKDRLLNVAALRRLPANEGPRLRRRKISQASPAPHG